MNLNPQFLTGKAMNRPDWAIYVDGTLRHFQSRMPPYDTEGERRQLTEDYQRIYTGSHVVVN